MSHATLENQRSEVWDAESAALSLELALFPIAYHSAWTAATEVRVNSPITMIEEAAAPGSSELARTTPGRHEEETAIRTESTGCDPLLTGRGQALILVLAGRFQPWHAGHHDLIVKLLTSRGAGILPDDYARSLLARFPVARLHVAVAQISPLNAENPLEVGQRRLLVETAVKEDPRLSPFRDKIFVDWIPRRSSVAAEHAEYMAALPPVGVAFFMSGNPATLAADRAGGIRCLQVQNRKDAQERSATRIRNLILNGGGPAMGEVKRELPYGVYEVMQTKGMFEQIRSLALGG